MRAELAAALCIPEDRPVNLEVDPVEAQARLSGKPSITADPVELELPEVKVTLPGVTVTLPNPKVKITVGLGTDNVIAYLQSMRTFLQSLPMGPLPPPAPVDVAIFGAAVSALAPGLTRALATPTFQLDADITLGEVKLTADKPLSVDMGDVRLHGVPVQGDDQRITIAADLDDTGLDAALSGLRAALTGCLVLNGGDPPPTKPPTVLGVKAKVIDEKYEMYLTVVGQGFGTEQGEGSVLLKQMGVTVAPDNYPDWSNQEIVARFHPIPAHGSYVVTVTNARGESAETLPVALP